MTQKPDYYVVLGVEKNATEAQIKMAFAKLAQQLHPDKYTGRSEAERKEAEAKFTLAREARDILTDPRKRTTYDQYGHEGLENVKGSGKPSPTATARPADATPQRRTVYSQDEVFDFFSGGKREPSERRPPSKPPSPTQPVSGGDANAEARRRAREARRAGHGFGPVDTPVTPVSTPPAKPSAADVFREAAQKVEEAKKRLRDAANGAEPSLDSLTRFRDSLRNIAQDVDEVIDRLRKNGGPRP